MATALASCDAIGVDPSPDVTVTLGDKTQLIEKSSDEYLSENEEFPFPVDLVFIDGLHLAEYVLRDFANVKRRSHEGTTVILDDVFPNSKIQARRNRSSAIWMGDVWLALQHLSNLRPDLTITRVDTWPSGLAVITNLDPSNETLISSQKSFTSLVASEPQVPIDVLKRRKAVKPSRALRSITAAAKRAR